MKFHHETPWRSGEEVEALKGQERREELTELLGQVLGTYGPLMIGEEMERVAFMLPDEKRSRFLEECAQIAQEAGWKYATETLLAARSAERRIRHSCALKERVETTYIAGIRRPDEISDIRDFFVMEDTDVFTMDSEVKEIVSYWIPTKRDIRRCVAIAEAAKKATKRGGPVRVLEVGGGSGFLSRLIADEMQKQGLPHEVTAVDPDQELVTAARMAHRDCEELHFVDGTAHSALEMFGPALDSSNEARLRAYELELLRLQEDVSERLGRVKATLETMEAWTTLDEALATPYGKAMRTAFRAAGISLREGERDKASVSKRLLAYYDSEFKQARAACTNVKNRMEELYLLHGRRRKEAPDLVLNSWMPTEIDLTRDLRMIGAPAILYAREPGGATGIDYPTHEVQSVADEFSYKTGRAYEEIDAWDGLAASGVLGGLETGYQGRPFFTEVQIQVRKDIWNASLAFTLPSVPDTDRYPWEASLERLIGKETMKRERYSSPIDPQKDVAIKNYLKAVRSGRISPPRNLDTF